MPRNEDYDGPRRRRRGGCGGYANYSGHCGATDCPSCHPSTWDQPDELDCDGCGEETDFGEMEEICESHFCPACVKSCDECGEMVGYMADRTTVDGLCVDCAP